MERRTFLGSALAAGGAGALTPAVSFADERICADPALPQDDPRPRLRRLRLAFERSRFRYDHGLLPPLAMAASVPRSHTPRPAWLLAVGLRLLNASVNARLVRGEGPAAARAAAIEETVAALTSPASPGAAVLREVSEAAVDTGALREPLTPDDYADLFRTVPLPAIAGEHRDDRVFAWMRVAGPNPVMLRRMDGRDERLALTAAAYAAAVPGDRLDAALAEGRLYVADYAALDGIETGFTDGLAKHVCAPLAAFALPPGGQDLVPVAIRCGQRPGPGNPLLGPGDGVAWQAAKTLVQIADANVHEAITHLGLTHLFVEPFVLATERQLAPTHPVGLLLRPHFEGTLAINDAARSILLAPGGLVDLLLAGTLAASRELAAGAVASRTLAAAALPADLERRGVADRDRLPVYPYRDDALLYWDAIERFVTDYVRTYYRSSAEVAGDPELAAWCREIEAADGGRLRAFGGRGPVRTRRALAAALTSLVFTCSAQHAAVNHPQYDHMAYAPAMPLAGFAPAPAGVSEVDEDYLARLLPPASSALAQLSILYLLGSVRYTTLGEYADTALCDPRVGPALGRFRRRLEAAGAAVAWRNRRRRPYPFLERAGIPQSINI